jgi:deoxyribonuclease-4
MILGAHVRRGGAGATGAVQECHRRGADCAQIFLSNPRAWSPPRHDRGEGVSFQAAWRDSGLGPLSVHAPYLVNTASANAELLAKSRDLLGATVDACNTVGADMLVVHAGSRGTRDLHDAIATAAGSFRQALERATRVRIVVELMAGTVGSVASTVAEAAFLLETVGDDRLGVCLDTCHLFAAGYALDTSEGTDALVAELIAHQLLTRVNLVHANDSAFGRGERRDRHAYLDAGRIGRAGWLALVASPLAAVPWITETAGDPDRQRADLEMLRRFAARPADALKENGARRHGSSSARPPSW